MTRQKKAINFGINEIDREKFITPSATGSTCLARAAPSSRLTLCIYQSTMAMILKHSWMPNCFSNRHRGTKNGILVKTPAAKGLKLDLHQTNTVTKQWRYPHLRNCSLYPSSNTPKIYVTRVSENNHTYNRPSNQNIAEDQDIGSSCSNPKFLLLTLTTDKTADKPITRCHNDRTSDSEEGQETEGDGF